MSVLIGIKENQRPIWLSDNSRMSGVYILGKSGMGKTVALTHMIATDIIHNNGLFCIDPHGDITSLLDNYLERRFYRHVVLNPEDKTHSFGINLFACADITNRNERQDTYRRAYGAFYRIWEKDFSERPWLQLFIQNTIYAFIENQSYTLAEVPMFLTPQMAQFRHHIVSNISQNTRVANFWYSEFARPERKQRERLDAALTRVETLLGHEDILHIVGQKQTTVDFTKIIEEGEAILLNLSANLPMDSKRFPGTIILSELLTAIRKRTTVNHKLFAIYIDEAQNFMSSEDFGTLFTEARKFGIATTIAHQERYGQLADNRKVAGAALAAVNKVCFQLSSPDAQELAPEFARQVQATEVRREPVYEPSPHAIEDIWERGHPDKWMKYIRRKYFWIVDLLKKEPTNEYYEFNPARIPPEEHEELKHGNLSYAGFSDWDYYRASKQMLSEGINALNSYLYDYMDFNYDPGKRITDKEIMHLFKIIENLSGVMGLRPAMCPYISDDMRERLAQSINARNTRLVTQFSDKWQKDHHRSYVMGFGQEASEGLNRELETTYKELAREWTELDVPMKLSLRSIPKIRTVALQNGFSEHDLARLIEWHPVFLESKERENLMTVIRIIANIRVDKSEYDALWQQVNRRYIAFLSHEPLVERLGTEYLRLPDAVIEPEQYRITERIVWQLTELQYFISHIRACGRILMDQPIEVATGRYEKRTKVERTQTDLNAETARELMNLSRFSAYAKYMEKDGKVWSGKVTGPEPKTISQLTELDRWWLDQADKKPFYRERAEIDREIRERQAKWRQTQSIYTGKIQPDAILNEPKSKEPPPRRS